MVHKNIPCHGDRTSYRISSQTYGDGSSVSIRCDGSRRLYLYRIGAIGIRLASDSLIGDPGRCGRRRHRNRIVSTARHNIRLNGHCERLRLSLS